MLIVATLSVSQAWSKEPKKTDNPLLGTWRTAFVIHEGSYGVKSFTQTHFNWYYAAANGIMYSSGAGTYEIQTDSHFVETLYAADPKSAAIIGQKAEIDFKLVGDTLFTNFVFMGQRLSEQWVRVD